MVQGRTSTSQLFSGSWTFSAWEGDDWRRSSLTLSSVGIDPRVTPSPVASGIRSSLVATKWIDFKKAFPRPTSPGPNR